MLNHLTWQKFRKSLISMASQDAKTGGKNPHFYCRKIFLEVVFHEHNMSIIWNSLAPRLEIIYCRKTQWQTRKMFFPIQFLAWICLPKGAGSYEHNCDCWHAYERWHSPLGQVHGAVSIIESKRGKHRGPMQSLISGPSCPEFFVYH